jgi:hypothetical protein
MPALDYVEHDIRCIYQPCSIFCSIVKDDGSLFCPGRDVAIRAVALEMASAFFQSELEV